MNALLHNGWFDLFVLSLTVLILTNSQVSPYIHEFFHLLIHPEERSLPEETPLLKRIKEERQKAKEIQENFATESQKNALKSLNLSYPLTEESINTAFENATANCPAEDYAQLAYLKYCKKEAQKLLKISKNMS